MVSPAATRDSLGSGTRASTTSVGRLRCTGLLCRSIVRSSRSICAGAAAMSSEARVARSTVTSANIRPKWSYSPSISVWCTRPPAAATAVAGMPVTAMTGTDSAYEPATPLTADSSPTPKVVTRAAAPRRRA